jgi:exosome complex component RRP41
MPVLIPEEKQKHLIKEDGKRLDGRALDEMRPFSCKIGVLENADGSAFVSHGGNRIYAGVYGPREVHPRHMAKSDRGILRVYYRMATFSVHERASPAPNRRALEISAVIEDAIEPTLFMELYPDSAIEVYVTVIAAEGGTRCASTTAVSLALADAGIPMKTLTAAIAAGKADGKIILDCSDEEDKGGDADMPCAILMKDEKISLLQFDGDMTPEEINTAITYVKQGVRKIFTAMNDAIKDKFNQIKLQTDEENKKLPQKESIEDGFEETEDFNSSMGEVDLDNGGQQTNPKQNTQQKPGNGANPTEERREQ